MISRVVVLVCNLTDNGGMLLSPHPCQYLLSPEFLMLAILIGMKWNLKVSLICLSLMTKDAEHFFWCLSAIQDSSAENSLALYCIFNRFICFLGIQLLESYILNISPLSDVRLVKIFSQSVGCSFCPIDTVLCLTEAFSFMRSHLSMI